MLPPTRLAPLHVFKTLRPCSQYGGSKTIVFRRGYAQNRLEVSQLEANTPLAKELKATRVWTTNHTLRRKADQKYREMPPPVPGDRTRINIVSEKLCDDILSYIGTSLERHKGCDLVDIYPGAGLWSSKLHDFLQPRSHILMEPDDKLYAPFLQPLLEKKGTKLVPKSGIVWGQLNSVLCPEFLPNQKKVDNKDERANAPNDTLLVTCNLAFHPRKRFLSFDSIALLLLHQFMDAIKTNSLFHKYGQVRMLVWARHGDKTNLIPRIMQKRKRTGTEGEHLCGQLHEVVGFNGRGSTVFVRDTTIERASALATLQRMKAAKIKVPEGRESDALKQAMADIKKRKNLPVPGATPPVIERHYHEVLESLKLANPRTGSNDHATLKAYGWRQTSDAKKNELYHQLLQRFDELSSQKAAGTLGGQELLAAEEELSKKIARLPFAAGSEFCSIRDNLHLWRQEPPVMHWDRRPIEPLIADEDEFYPNVDCSLIDIQPQPVHHLIRDIGGGASRSGECVELIQKALWSEPKATLDKALDSVWPGAADWLLPRCPSLHDPAQGGVGVKVRGMELTVRTLNIKQWEELLTQWFEWPFRPEFQDLVARSQDYTDEEELISAGGHAVQRSADA